MHLSRWRPIGPLVVLLGSANSGARVHAEGALVRLSIESANRAIIIEKLVGMLHTDEGAATGAGAGASSTSVSSPESESL